MQAHRGRVPKHAGFTLVELVVVVMILGILAAVAAPKLLSTSSAATENGVKHTLAVVRDAIERYAADNGGQLPGSSDGLEATFKTDLQDYLRGTFPVCPIKNNAQVKMDGVSTPLTGSAIDAEAWRYSHLSGQFIVNSAAPLENEPTVNYDQL